MPITGPVRLLLGLHKILRPYSYDVSKTQITYVDVLVPRSGQLRMSHPSTTTMIEDRFATQFETELQRKMLRQT